MQNSFTMKCERNSNSVNQYERQFYKAKININNFNFDLHRIWNDNVRIYFSFPIH